MRSGVPVKATDVVRHRTLSNQPGELKETLTNREQEVLKWVVGGKDVPTVGLILGIQAKTVESHLTNVMRKLDVHGRADLVVEAIRLGFVECPCAGCQRKVVAA